MPSTGFCQPTNTNSGDLNMGQVLTGPFTPGVRNKTMFLQGVAGQEWVALVQISEAHVGSMKIRISSVIKTK